MEIDYDRLKYSLTGEYEERMLEKELEETKKKLEEANEIIKEITNYAERMSYASVIDNPKKDLVKILKRVDKK